MKIKNVIITLVLAVVSILNLNVAFDNDIQNSLLSNLFQIQDANAELSTGYDKEVNTQEDETEQRHGMTCTRSRHKTSCEGSGITPCTSHGWTSWSEWSCN